MTSSRKVVLVGTGMVGMSYAYALLNQSACDELLLIDIDAARAEGDLSENGGYQAAREEQGKNEGRINELIVKLRNAKILEAPEAGLVGNGSVVTMDMAGREMVVVLGSRDIAVATDYDVISPESPIGAAIMGAHAGDTVSYQAPNGREISVTIKDAKPLN